MSQFGSAILKLPEDQSIDDVLRQVFGYMMALLEADSHQLQRRTAHPSLLL